MKSRKIHAPPAMLRPAVFLDRDGTINEEVHYLSDPDDLRLIPGAAGAIRRLRAAGFACVVVTNQSAVGRGMITESQLERIHDRLNELLGVEGAELDAVYSCTAGPPAGPGGPEHPDRKPAPGMLLRAAADHRLDLGASWAVGDMVRDLLAGRNAGCRGGLLVLTGKGQSQAAEGLPPGTSVVNDLTAAADWILSDIRRPPP